MSATELEINELARSLNKSHSFLTSEEGIETKSGLRLKVYFDVADKIISHPDSKLTVVRSLAGMFWYSGIEVKHVAGVPRGMDTIVSTLADRLNLSQLKVNPEAKNHGTGLQIEGDFAKGDKVALFEDVVTQGGSSINKGYLPLQSAGLKVVGFFALISRPYGGMEAIRKAIADPKIPVLAYCQDLVLLQSGIDQNLFHNNPENPTRRDLIEAEIARQLALLKD